MDSKEAKRKMKTQIMENLLLAHGEMAANGDVGIIKLTKYILKLLNKEDVILVDDSTVAP